MSIIDDIKRGINNIINPPKESKTIQNVPPTTYPSNPSSQPSSNPLFHNPISDVAPPSSTNPIPGFENGGGGGGGGGGGKRYPSSVNPLPNFPDNNNGGGGSGAYTGTGSNPLTSDPLTRQLEEIKRNQAGFYRSLPARDENGNLIVPPYYSYRTKKNIDEYNAAIEDYNKRVQEEKNKYYQNIYNLPEGTSGYTSVGGYDVIINPVNNQKRNLVFTESKPTTSEVIQGTIRRATGISVPTPNQAYNFIIGGANYGTPEANRKISISNIPNDLLQASLKPADYAGETTSYFVEKAGGSSNLAKYSGLGVSTAGKAGIILASSSERVVGAGGATAFNVLFGAGLAAPGIRTLTNPSNNFGQRLLGAGEAFAGGFLATKGLTSEFTVGTVSSGLTKASRIVKPAIRTAKTTAKNVYRVLEPVKASDWGYIGRSPRGKSLYALENAFIFGTRTGTEEANIGFNIARKSIGGQLNVLNQNVIKAESEAINLGKNIANRVGGAFNTIKSNVKETLALAPQSRMVRIGASFVKETPKTVRGFVNAIRQPLGILKRSEGVSSPFISKFVEPLGVLRRSEGVSSPILTPIFEEASSITGKVYRPIVSVVKIGTRSTARVGNEIISGLRTGTSETARAIRIGAINTGRVGAEIINPIKNSAIWLIKADKNFGQAVEYKVGDVLFPALKKANTVANNLIGKALSPIGKTILRLERRNFFPGDYYYGNVVIGKEAVSLLKKPLIKYGEKVSAASKKAALEHGRISLQTAETIIPYESPGITFNVIRKAKPSVLKGITFDVKPISTIEVPSSSGQVLVTSLEQPMIVTGQQSSLIGEFTGRNLYEVSGLSASAAILNSNGLSQTQILESPSKINNQQFLSSNVESANKFNQKELLSPLVATKEETKTNHRTRQIEKFKISEIQSQPDAQMFRQNQQQRENQLLKQEQLFRKIQIYRNKPGIKSILISPGISNKRPLINKIREAFNVVVYNRGKEQTIAKGLPFRLAERTGVRNVLSNLRASFKLVPAGSTDIEDINFILPSSFRPSKREKLRFVQKLNTRFGTRTETKEAQFFRKQKANKIKWF